jgi:hypothetical protein
MLFQQKSPNSKDIFNDVLSGLEKWCETFNQFILTLFIFMKFIFVIVLFSLGFLTLFKLRRVYFDIRTKYSESKEDPLKKERLIVGFTYIFMALGFLFNFLTIFLMWMLDPLPDRFIFNFINFNGNINPEYMNRIEDIESSKYPHEKTIYYCFALGSFYSFLHLLINLWLILHNRGVKKPEQAILNVIGGISGCLMFGFTTFMPLFL